MRDLPWDEWVLPPKSMSKTQQQQRQLSPRKRASEVPVEALEDAMATLSLQPTAPLEKPGAAVAREPVATATEGTLLLPQLDLSSLTAPASINNESQTVVESISKKKPAATTPSAKKARIRSYVAHFAHANAALPAFPHELSTRDDDDEVHEIKWNGEPIRVKVACESSSSYQDVAHYSTHSNQVEDDTAGVTAIQHVFELQQLVRIRPHADGFRDNNVNFDCTFTPLTSPSSSSSSSPSSASSSFSDDDGSLPVFQKGDRVLFRAKHRRLKGKIARRIKKSSFYDVKAANGTLFLAVSALRIRLLPPDEEVAEPPLFNFQRGDRVLWRTNSTLTYKARVLRLRSLHRFDIQLRTGRVRQKIPYEELRPRSHDN